MRVEVAPFCPLRYSACEKPKITPCITRPRNFSESPDSAPMMRLDVSLGGALYEARNQYIDWQEFILWARSILEVEGRVPDWLAETLNNRCPRFSSNREPNHSQSSKEQALFLFAWKIGLMNTFLSLPREKAGSTQLPITQ